MTNFFKDQRFGLVCTGQMVFEGNRAESRKWEPPYTIICMFLWTHFHTLNKMSLKSRQITSSHILKLSVTAAVLIIRSFEGCQALIYPMFHVPGGRVIGYVNEIVLYALFACKTRIRKRKFTERTLCFNVIYWCTLLLLTYGTTAAWILHV